MEVVCKKVELLVICDVFWFYKLDIVSVWFLGMDVCMVLMIFGVDLLYGYEWIYICLLEVLIEFLIVFFC